MIRLILAFGFLVLFLVFSMPAYITLYFIGKKNPQRRDIVSLRIVQWAFRCVRVMVGAKVEVINQDKIPADQSVLYVANHNSYFDIIFTYALCPGLTGYVAKDGLGKVPLLNLWMKRLHCLFMKRDDMKASLKTILEAIDLVKNGVSICIFPEGTRGDSEEMLPFKEGAMKIAQKTGCPVVPIAISNSRKVWENQFPAIRKAHVIIEYCDPIYPKELPKDQQKSLGKLSQDRIQEVLDKNATMIRTI